MSRMNCTLQSDHLNRFQLRSKVPFGYYRALCTNDLGPPNEPNELYSSIRSFKQNSSKEKEVLKGKYLVLRTLTTPTSRGAGGGGGMRHVIGRRDALLD